jgi:peroxiredoxin
VCHGQLAQLRDKTKEFEDRGAQLLAVDPHESFRVRHLLRDVGLRADALTYPILADPAATVSSTYGVAYQMNIHTEWSNRPATFIIDKEGVLRYERRAKTYSDRPTADELLGELDRLADRNRKAR